MSISARILTLAAALGAALVVATGSTAQGTPGSVSIDLSFNAVPTLTVRTLTPSSGGGVVTLILGGGGGTPMTPAQVSVDLGPGYSLQPTPPGSQVGLATFTSADPGSGVVFLNGTLTADDPSHYATDPAAQTCAAGPYAAVWKLTTSTLGLSFVLPIFVQHPAGDTSRTELRFCVPPLTDSQGKPVTTGPVPIADASLFLFAAHGPAAKGRYVSNAYITPAGDGGVPDQASTVEARALEPIPHSLTLKGRYDPKTHSAVLTGKVVEAGKPQSRAPVEYFNVNNLSGGMKQVRTNTRGLFTARVRIAGTTTFIARVDDAVGPCGGTSTAPAGCVSLTLTGTNTASVKVAVRP